MLRQSLKTVRDLTHWFSTGMAGTFAGGCVLLFVLVNDTNEAWTPEALTNIRKSSIIPTPRVCSRVFTLLFAQTDVLRTINNWHTIDFMPLGTLDIKRAPFEQDKHLFWLVWLLFWLVCSCAAAAIISLSLLGYTYAWTGLTWTMWCTSMTTVIFTFRGFLLPWRPSSWMPCNQTLVACFHMSASKNGKIKTPVW